MPLPRQAQSSGNMRELSNLFRMNPGAFPGVNPGAFGNELNNQAADDTADYKTNSPEMQREQGIISGGDARAEVGIRHDLEMAQKEYDANKAGFPNAEAQADEEYQKAYNMHTGPARIAGQSAVQAAKESATAKASALETLLTATGAGGFGNRSVSVPGVGSVGAARREPPAAHAAAGTLNKLTTAKMAMEKHPTKSGFFDTLMGRSGQPSPEADAYQQAQGNALQGIHPNLVGLARKIATDYPGADVMTALGALGEDSLNEGELQQVQNALLVLRGH